MVKCRPVEVFAKQPTKQSNLGMTWILYMDRASNSQESRAKLMLTKSKGPIIDYALHFSFKVTKNQAEYKALLVGLKLTK